MKGSYHIHVSNRSLIYDFTIIRNITILQGDSATGKTTLVEMIREYEMQGPDSAITLTCSRPCSVLEGNNWEKQLREQEEESIIFIDEGSRFVNSKEFADAVKKCGHYFVIVTRESLYNLPYSVSEIYGIHSSGKYNSLKPVYHEFYHIYGDYEKLAGSRAFHIDTILTEDSNSGYEFFSGISQEKIKCFSAGGNSNVLPRLEQNELKERSVLVIADGAAFGSFMAKLFLYMSRHENIFLYLPESFEWLILSSGLIESTYLKEILDKPEDYIESSEYVSWEQFFTALLIEETKGTYLQYQKSKINPVYLQEHEARAVMNIIPEVIRAVLDHNSDKDQIV